MTPAFPKPPNDSVQFMVHPDPWWQDEPAQTLVRGRLVRAFIPFVEQQPFVLIPEGRSDPLSHEKATYRMVPFSLKDRQPPPQIPVAGLPHAKGERRFVYRGKVRPALVLSVGGDDVPHSLVSASARWITSRTILVAPYFGADQDGSRGGWPPAFVQRIRRAAYPQYVWDYLPLGDVQESILRLDQIQAIGSDPKSLEVMPYRLADVPMQILDEWLCWLVQGGLSPDGLLSGLREGLLSAG
ncbi:MAG: hypothetical protein ACLP66_10355 [Polyangia bacterium]